MIDLKKIKNQIIVFAGTIALFFGLFAIDDRWNQAEGVDDNCEKIDSVRNEMIDIASQLSTQMSLSFQEQRLQDLQNTLLKLKMDRKKNPDDQDIKDWIKEYQDEIQRTKELIQKLREKEKG